MGDLYNGSESESESLRSMEKECERETEMGKCRKQMERATEKDTQEEGVWLFISYTKIKVYLKMFCMNLRNLHILKCIKSTGKHQYI